MPEKIIAVLVAIIILIGYIAVLSFLFSNLPNILNPSPESAQKITSNAVNTLVDVVTPWWFPLLGWGVVGAIIIVLIAFFAPTLLRT